MQKPSQAQLSTNVLREVNQSVTVALEREEACRKPGQARWKAKVQRVFRPNDRAATGGVRIAICLVQRHLQSFDYAFKTPPTVLQHESGNEHDKALVYVQSVIQPKVLTYNA